LLESVPGITSTKKISLEPGRFGPWAVVTGASSGIGAEFARRVAQAGINLVLVSRRSERLQEVGRRLAEAHGIEYRVVVADLSASGATGTVTEATADLDVGLLISNAGTGRPGNFLAFEEAELRGIAELNAISHMVLTNHYGRRMAARGKGGVIMISAMGADFGIPYSAKEAATKALVTVLGRGINPEFKRCGLNLTVLVVSPTDTPVFETLGVSRSDMPIKPLKVQQCVDEGLRALLANRATHMPGQLYRTMMAIIPPAAARYMTGRMMRRSTRFVE
jgi:short-subunit dehydrogenase